MALWQVFTGGERRLARGPAGRGPEQLLPASATIDSLLGEGPDALAAVLGGPAAGPVPPGSSVLAPIVGQEVWAAGVTYTRSLDARALESGTRTSTSASTRRNGRNCSSRRLPGGRAARASR